MRRAQVAALLPVASFLACAVAFAQLGPAPPREVHWRLQSTVGLGANELVGGWVVRPFVYIPYGRSTNWLFEQAHFRAGPSAMVSPAIARTGAFVGISPALFLDLDLTYFAILDWSAKRFDGIHQNYAPHVREEMETEFVLGHILQGAATVKAKAGRAILLSTTEGGRWVVPENYFNIELYAILTTGWLVRNQTILGYQVSDRVIPFVQNELLHYYPTSYEKDNFGFGLLIDRVLPGTSLVVITAYHVENPDFQGIKFLVALLSEWQLSGTRLRPAPAEETR